MPQPPRIPHPAPALARRGVTIAAPGPKIPKVGSTGLSPNARETSRPGLIDQLPETKVVTLGFEAIEIAPGVTQAAGKSMWYSLGRIRPGPGEELFLNSIEVTQASCDAAGTAGTSAISWGDKLGRGAAIVIGERLPVEASDLYSPIEAERYTQMAFNYPGFRTDQVASTLTYATPFTSADENSFLYVRDFCAGQLTDAQPYKWSTSKHYGAFGRRISDTSWIDVCLVFRPDTFNQGDAESERYIYGHAVVQLFFGTTRGRGQFNKD